MSEPTEQHNVIRITDNDNHYNCSDDDNDDDDGDDDDDAVIAVKYHRVGHRSGPSMSRLVSICMISMQIT